MELDINNPEQIKLMIAMLQKLLPDNDKENTIQNETQAIKQKTVSSKNQSRHNKFVDMPEKNMHKEDVAFDKKVSVVPPTPRNRNFIPLDVKCRICGKHEKINPAILPDSAERYKCNKCSTSPGG